MSYSQSFLLRTLNRIERVGNRLPHPTALFVYLCIFIIALSWLSATAQVSALHPGTGEELAARSLLSGEGLRWMLTNTVSNFINFAPVGTVLIAILGIGTLMAMMVPYSVAFLLGWSIMLVLWMGLGWPIGPGGAEFLVPAD